MSEAVLSVEDAEPRRISEDWLAVLIGLGVFALALLSYAGVDALGWVATTSVWTDPGAALAPASKAYAALGGAGALLLTYLALLLALSLGALALGEDVRRFALAFTAVFSIAYACWFLGGWARLAAVTPAEQAKFGLSWSLKLTSEGGFIVALLAGLAIANFFPAFAQRLRSAIRRGAYIKIAIVILGAFIAVTAAGKLNLASSLLLRGVAAIVEAYLIYWPIVYLIARKGFGFSREWSAPLASGISICGVAAAIATGGAIRARPQVPVLVSSLVVIFAVIEVLVLPAIARRSCRTIDWTHFTPGSALAGGLLVGLAVAWLILGRRASSAPRGRRRLGVAGGPHSAALARLALARGGAGGVDCCAACRARPVRAGGTGDRGQRRDPDRRRIAGRFRHAARQWLHQRTRRLRPRAAFAVLACGDCDVHGVGSSDGLFLVRHVF